MSFGICSAPEVFQHGMHELIEGLHGTEVIARDFAVVGFGDILDEATSDHARIWIIPTAMHGMKEQIQYGQGTIQEADGIYWKCSHKAGSVCEIHTSYEQ